jgi:regulator of sigma E protease
MEILVRVAQLLLSLSILVLLHEGGHFLFAKLFKTRVEKFYLFFNPWFSLFKFKKGETEYGVGWLPLGGYVKIAGMMDESMDKEQLKEPAQPWEFRAKPSWQRLFIMIGGVLVNFVLALFIYIAVLYTWGEEYIANKDVTYGIQADSLAQRIGFRNGDKIISLDGKPLENIATLQGDIIFNEVKNVKVKRDGKPVNVSIDKKFVPEILKAKGMFGPRAKYIVEDVAKDMPAKAAGVKAGDRLIKVDTASMTFVDEYRTYFSKHKNKQVALTIVRGKDTVNLNVAPNENGLIGTALSLNQFKFSKIEYGFWASIPAGIGHGFDKTVNYVKQLKLIFSPETKAYESLGGFIAIGKFFPGTWDWYLFWNMTAFLSIILAVMNILPIPALDGGHVMFLLYEIVTRRKPSEKFMEYAQIVGMVILFALLIFANGNDIVKLFKH